MTEHLRHLIVIALIIIIIEKYKDIKLTLTDKGQKAAASQKEQNIWNYPNCHIYKELNPFKDTQHYFQQEASSKFQFHISWTLGVFDGE